MYTTNCPVCGGVMGVAVIPELERKKNPSKVYPVTCPKCETKFSIESNGQLKKMTGVK